METPHTWILVLIGVNLLQFFFNLLFVSWLYAQIKDDTTPGGIPMDRIEKYQKGEK